MPPAVPPSLFWVESPDNPSSSRDGSVSVMRWKTDSSQQAFNPLSPLRVVAGHQANFDCALFKDAAKKDTSLSNRFELDASPGLPRLSCPPWVASGKKTNDYVQTTTYVSEPRNALSNPLATLILLIFLGKSAWIRKDNSFWYLLAGACCAGNSADFPRVSKGKVCKIAKCHNRLATLGQIRGKSDFEQSLASIQSTFSINRKFQIELIDWLFPPDGKSKVNHPPRMIGNLGSSPGRLSFVTLFGWLAEKLDLPFRASGAAVSSHPVLPLPPLYPSLSFCWIINILRL